jgi:hypothetical protein
MVLCTQLEIMSLTRHILEIMVSKFSNIMININKVIRNRSSFLSGGVTLRTQNVKYFYHLSVHVSLRLLKAYLRSTMDQCRLTSLALMHIRRDITVNTQKIVANFVTQSK